MEAMIEQLKREHAEHLKAAQALVNIARAANRDFTADESAQVEKHLDEAKKLKARIAQAERDAEVYRVANLLGGYSDRGAIVCGSWGKAFKAALPFAGIGAKDLISPSGSVQVPNPTDTLAPLGADPGKVETLLQLIPRQPLNGSDGFSFLRETVRTHNAAVVAAKGIKPESVYTVERQDDRARVIAHLSEPVPRQYLADFPLLQRYLDAVLKEGLQLALESEIISGDGTGEHFTGLLGTSGVQEQLFDTDVLTTTRKAITLLEIMSIMPGAFVLHPSDWETFELTANTVGDYMLKAPDAGQSLPVDRARRRLWGLPVALSIGITQGTAILADFAGSTQLFEHEVARVDWSENTYDSGAGASDFQRNLIRFRAEGRWGFAVLRPAGVVVVNLEITS